MLLDSETFDLVQHIDTVLAAVAGHELEPRINSELMQSVLEVATPVCHTPAGVRQQLLRIRRYVTDVAGERGRVRPSHQTQLRDYGRAKNSNYPEDGRSVKMIW